MTLAELTAKTPNHDFVKAWVIGLNTTPSQNTASELTSETTYSFTKDGKQKYTLKRFQLEIHNADFNGLTAKMKDKKSVYRFKDNKFDKQFTFKQLKDCRRPVVEKAFVAEMKNRGRLNLKAITVAEPEKPQTYMLRVESNNYLRCRKLDNFFDVMKFGTNSLNLKGQKVKERKRATLTRVELLTLHPFIQEHPRDALFDRKHKIRCKALLERDYVKFEGDVRSTPSETLTVILLTLRCEVTLEVRYLMVKVDAADKNKNSDLVDAITKQLKELQWIRPDLAKREYTHKLGTAAFRNSDTGKAWTRDDFTVAQSQSDWYEMKPVKTPQAYRIHAKPEKGGQGRLEKNQYFSGYMKDEEVGIPSTIWNPKKANLGTIRCSNNLDKRHCPKCKLYYQYRRGETKTCERCHEETRHPYYTHNLLNGKDKNDDTKYDDIWCVGKSYKLKKNRGDMHASWGHQLFKGELSKIAKVCGFAV